MKKWSMRAAMLFIVLIMASEYARWTWDVQWRAEQIVNGLAERPQVYRALVPWLAYILVLMGLRPEQALTIVVVLSAIGLIYGIVYFSGSVERE